MLTGDHLASRAAWQRAKEKEGGQERREARMRPVEGDAYADLEPPSHRPTCSSRYERIGVGRGGATVRGLSWATAPPVTPVPDLQTQLARLVDDRSRTSAAIKALEDQHDALVAAAIKAREAHRRERVRLSNELRLVAEFAFAQQPSGTHARGRP
uniref:Uncharacterized protein n=1 Tax=Emiliania huxleyi TaxID=2903 RepID=A0A7S3RSB3_EMIHU